MGIFSALSISTRLAISIPARALRNIISAFGRAIKFVFDTIIRCINFVWDAIVQLARGTSWLRRRTSDLIYFSFSIGAVVTLFLLPWALAWDPLNLSRFAPFDYQILFYWMRLGLAAFFAICFVMFVVETYKDYKKGKIEGELAMKTFAEIFFRLISDVSSWLLFAALAVYLFAYKVGIPIDLRDFPNRLPSLSEISYILKYQFGNW